MRWPIGRAWQRAANHVLQETLMEAASVRDNQSTIEVLLDAGADFPNAGDKDGRSPLLRAAENEAG